MSLVQNPCRYASRLRLRARHAAVVQPIPPIVLPLDQQLLPWRAPSMTDGSNLTDTQEIRQPTAILSQKRCYSTSSIRPYQFLKLKWVPEAYRGAPIKEESSPSSSSQENKDQSKKQHRSTPRKGGIHHGKPKNQIKRKRPTPLERLKADEAQQDMQKIKVDMNRVEFVSGEVQRLLTSYYMKLDPSATMDEHAHKSKTKQLNRIDYASPDKLKGQISHYLQLIRDTTQQITQIERVPRERLADSDDTFRALCRVLQDLVPACCQVYSHESQKTVTEIVDCAEACLKVLVDLRAHRGILFDRWQEESTFEEEVHENPSWIKPFTDVVQFITESISSKPLREETKAIDKTLLAHEEETTALSDQSFRLLSETMASAASYYEDPKSKVVNLLSLLPEGTIPESKSLLSIMEILCRDESLEAAQECQRLFEEYSPEIPHLPFSMVLQAYLEASRKETVYERKQEIIKDVLHIFKTRWDSLLPQTLDERVAQAASVLHCIAACGVSTDPEILAVTDTVVRKCLGADYWKVYAAATSIGGNIESKFVPLVNFLARIYASSGQQENISLSKKMIQNILPDDENRGSGHVLYPNIETVNSVLDGILRLHQEGNGDLDESADLAFAESVLEFALSRRESSVWANGETFELLMNLYTTLKPANIGRSIRMEDLISHYETRAYLYEGSGISISMSAYNRLIWCLWEEAKLGQPRRASQRAMAVVQKLERISTPLLLSPEEITPISDFEIYDFALKPTAKTYELLLNVCADTASRKEFDMAANVAIFAGSRLLTFNNFKRRCVERLRTCLDRLRKASDLRPPLEAVLADVEEKISQVSDTDGKSATDEVNDSHDGLDDVEEVNVEAL